METSYKYDVSVIVVTYNSEFEKLRVTIESILIQKEVRFEIIIADDGSSDNHQNLIELLFQKKQFNHYKFIGNLKNSGTVKNYLSGLYEAEGEYTKSISPGDYLFDSLTLRPWVDFMRENNYLWSFSDVVNYNYEKDHMMIPLSKKAYPQYIKPYLKKQYDKCRWNYVVLNDIALGAALLGDTQLILKYCERICQHSVIYAEDNIWRLMMFDGIVGGYYPDLTVVYEFGTGISTNNNAVWNSRLTNDWLATDNMMYETPEPDAFQRSMLYAMKKQKGSLFKKLFTKGKICMIINNRLNIRMTTCEIPKWLQEIKQCK